MQIDRDAVLDVLRSHGREADVAEASRELPDAVDPDRDAELLERFGVDRHELLASLPERVRNRIPPEMEKHLGEFGV